MIIRACLFSIFSYSIIVKLSFGFYFPRFIEEKTLLNLINFHNEFLLFFIREIVRQRNKETLTIAVKIGCLFTNHQIFQFAFVIFFLIIFFNFKRISHISMIRQIGKILQFSTIDLWILNCIQIRFSRWEEMQMRWNSIYNKCIIHKGISA